MNIKKKLKYLQKSLLLYYIYVQNIYIILYRIYIICHIKYIKKFKYNITIIILLYLISIIIFFIFDLILKKIIKNNYVAR